MTFFKYIKLLTVSNSGQSSKGFLFVSVTLSSLALIAICGISLIVDVLVNGHIETDLVGMAALIGSISTLLGAVGLTKVYGDKFDYQSYKDERDFNYNSSSSSSISNSQQNNSAAEAAPKISPNDANSAI